MRQEIRGGYHRMGDGLCGNEKVCVTSLLNNTTNHHEICSFVSLIHDDNVSCAPKSYKKCYLYDGLTSKEKGNCVRIEDGNDSTVPAINQDSDDIFNKREKIEESHLRVKPTRNQPDSTPFTSEESSGHEESNNHTINVANDQLSTCNKVASGDLELLQCSIAPQITKSKFDRCTKFPHISFDTPKKKKECVLVSCPSLDSSLSNDSQSVPCPGFFQSQQFFDPSQSSAYLLTSHNVIPLTTATPSSCLASQASLDSGVLSTLSLDMSHANGNENWAKRRRTASSVSSGTSEMWQSSLDGEGSALEAVSENLDAYEDCEAVFTFRMKKSEGCESLHSCLNVSSHNGNEALQICAQPNAHLDNKDHSISMPYNKKLDLCFSRTDTVKEKHKSIKVNDINNSKQTEKPVRYNLNADKYFGSNVAASQKIKREELLKERYTPEVLRKMEKYAANLVILVLSEALSQSVSLGWSIKCSGQCNQVLCREDYNNKNKKTSKDKKEKEIQTEDRSRYSNLGLSNCSSSLCWTPEISFSPSHRPHSRSSKRSSLSFSHDSLISGGTFQDDSHLITGAVSHDTLTFTTVKSMEMAKSCLTCLENEIYSLPIDMVKPYQGPILQPKVIVQQPKRRHPNRISKGSREQDVIGGPNSKRKISGNKQKRIKPNQSENHKDQSESFRTNKRNTIHLTNNNCRENLEDEKLSPEAVSNEKLITEVSDTKKEKSKDIVKVENVSSEHSKVCRLGLVPFATSKSQKRKEHLSSKGERKKGRSFSSNLRNTLFTIFSFRRNQKESCVNAKNEFIDASSQGFQESSEGLKWGKICPLPSAPPLRTSAKNSAFTDHVTSSSISNSTLQGSSVKQNNGSSVENRCSNNKENNSSGNHRQSSNSISPASLLSCLGHPRTNSISEYDHQTRLGGVTLSKCPSTMVTSRALPPLPSSLNDDGKSSNAINLNLTQSEKIDEGCDFASNIEKVKNYGWYWGPISGEAAEKVLSNEPDGSFIVRDSSDYHYIFSLTFRLNGVTSHVRIEHDQGNFSFGGFTRFKSQTIVDFIEKAVEHSRSGRYLFFLHRRPVLGPMRVQLLHPVSRFKHVQSLQHLCRFVIVKQVRKDLIPDLPLPQRLKDYLNSPHYYSEQVEQCMSLSSALSTDEGSPSPISEHSTSPCSSAVANVSGSFRRHHSLTRSVCPSSAPMRITSNNLFLNLRCSFPNSTSPLDRNFKYCRPKNVRLTSSHSSLDTNTLHAAAASAYPISSSTLSSESTSGRFCSFKCNSQHRKCRFLSASSHSSPSSPIPFDYSPPEWLSSSDDNLKKSSVDSSLNSKKTCPLVPSTNNQETKSTCNNVTQQSILTDASNGTRNSGDFVASASESLQSVVSKSALQTNCLNVCDNNHFEENEIRPINYGVCEFKL